MYDNDPNPDLDLYMRNSPLDLAVEPDNVTGDIIWNSPDIWVRNQQDGRYIQEHENPEFDNNDDPGQSYVYVKIRNTSCNTSISNNELKLYWAKSGTYLVWPESWDGSTTMYNNMLDEEVLMGDAIATINIPSLAPGQETILEIPWSVPNPYKYRGINPEMWQFSLLARIESVNDPMTFTETSNTLLNVKNNNNIVLKNTTVVDILPGTIIGSVLAIGNYDEIPKDYTLELLIDPDETGKTIYEESEINLKMNDVLYDAWEDGGNLGSNFTVSAIPNKLIVTDNHVFINNIHLEPNEVGTLYISFNFLSKEITNKTSFSYHIIQRDAITNEIVGGNTYRIGKQPRDFFVADAGDDKEIEKFDSITISADEINELAIYNWYDPEGNLIYTGSELTISPAITKIYKLEIITEIDGYKDYDEIKVTVNPYSIDILSPNPADNQVTINYKAQEASSAYFMLISATNSTSDNYIIDTSVFETTLDVSNYQAGLYHLSLICDGILIESKNLVIE